VKIAKAQPVLRTKPRRRRSAIWSRLVASTPWVAIGPLREGPDACAFVQTALHRRR
jgi:hypothetical protein